MAKSRNETKKQAEDLMSVIVASVSGALKGQAKISAKDMPAYKAAYAAEKNKENEKGDKNDSNKLIAGFIQKLMAMLAPAAILATILASQASGMSVFFGAVKILGNTLGSVLLPFIMLGGAAILTLSDIIMGALIPNLEDWYTFILSGAVGLIDGLETGIDVFITGMTTQLRLMEKGVGDFSLGVAKMLSVIITMLNMAAKFTDKNPVSRFLGANSTDRKNPVSDFLRDRAGDVGLVGGTAALSGQALKKDAESGEGANELTGKIKEFMNSKLKLGGGQLGGAFRDNLTAMIQQMKHENAPASKDMGIADAAKAAQNAAFQMSPFEQKTSDMMVKILDSLERANAKLTPGATQ